MSGKEHWTSEQKLVQPLVREQIETQGFHESLLGYAEEACALAASPCRQPDWAAYCGLNVTAFTCSRARRRRASHHSEVFLTKTADFKWSLMCSALIHKNKGWKKRVNQSLACRRNGDISSLREFRDTATQKELVDLNWLQLRTNKIQTGKFNTVKDDTRWKQTLKMYVKWHSSILQSRDSTSDSLTSSRSFDPPNTFSLLAGNGKNDNTSLTRLL